MLLLNYANHAFRTSQRKNARTGLTTGGFDRVVSFGPQDIDLNFRLKNQKILDEEKGNGYWLWKPYFIHRILREMEESEWLFYCDSGAYFIHSIQPLVEVAEERQLEVMTFADGHLEKKYTKRDTLLSLDADNPAVINSPQRLGGFSLWRKSSQSLDFTSQWLSYAQRYQLISDAENQMGAPNYPEFVAHRHDQSIFSILAKKHGFTAFRDPSQWGNSRLTEYSNSPYPQLIQLTRQRDVPLRTRIKRRVKKFWQK